jgi:hypothetical protein
MIARMDTPIVGSAAVASGAHTRTTALELPADISKRIHS